MASVGKAFTVDGTAMVYGYPADRRDDPDRCYDCGGWLSDFDLKAATIPGYHFDCSP